MKVEKFWYGSYYILACCSRNANFAPGIFGNWVTTDKPNWGPYSDNPKAPDYSDDFNSLLSLGLLKVVFKGILDISDELDEGHDKREKWLHILENLSDFPM